MRKVIGLLLFAGVLTVFADQSGPTITPYGLAQYRLRARINTDADTIAKTTEDYANQIGYYVGLNAKVNDELSMQFQIGNDWVATDAVSYLANDPAYVTSTTKGLRFPGNSMPYFHLAYAKWDPGYLSITAGIVPVVSDGSLDLLERSLFTSIAGSKSGWATSPNYKGAAFVGWANGMNNAIEGLKIGVPILKQGFLLRADLLTSIIDTRTATLTAPEGYVLSDPTPDFSSVLGVLQVPMGTKDYSIAPEVYGVMDRLYNTNNGKRDNEYGLGLTASYFFNKVSMVNASFGYASVSNANSLIVGDSTNSTSGKLTGSEFDNTGWIVDAGTTIGVGPGTIVFEAKYSNANNTQLNSDTALFHYVYGDLKYNWNINKNFTITPRLRNFTTILPEKNALVFTMENRPELILTGKF